MDARTWKVHGRELGNAAAAGQILGISWETYQWYVRRDKRALADAIEARKLDRTVPIPDRATLAPEHVDTDPQSGERRYALKAVRAFARNRVGRGNWRAIRRAASERSSAPAEREPVPA